VRRFALSCERRKCGAIGQLVRAATMRFRIAGENRFFYADP
jgi:hypothetical protein